MDIFEQIKTGDESSVEKLVADYPALLDSTNASGLRPVLVALYYGKRDLAEKLRARMDALTIFEACALGEVEAVRQAVHENEVQLDALSPDGFTPLGLAAFFGQVEVVVWLLEQGADLNKPAQNAMAVFPINSAAAHRGKEAALSMVKLLIEYGANVNAAQHGGWTPLHQAASHGFEQTVRLLLNAGANPDIKSEDGRTARDMAEENGHRQVVELLQGFAK